MQRLNKKGQVLDGLAGIGIGVASLAITLIIAFLIISQAQSNLETTNQLCANSTMFYNATANACCASAVECDGANQTQAYSNAYNGTATLQTATQTIPGWVPLIIIGVVGALLLGLVSMFRK